MTFRAAVINDSMATALSTTTNGMVTNVSSADIHVDLFSVVASSRGKDLTPLFELAFSVDPDLTNRIMLWTRDIRGGAGERETFRKYLAWLDKNHTAEAIKVLFAIPHLGRWDDMLVVKTAICQSTVGNIVFKALAERNGLAAKWMPRKGYWANYFARLWGMTIKDYRKAIVEIANVVESQMCAKDWTNINYNHVPSVAASRYHKAFSRHDPAGYAAWKAGLVKGTSKINASVVYPYDVIRSMRYGDRAVADAQWKALPDYLNTDQNVLAVVDTSGSMTQSAGSATVSCLDVAVSLGLYVSEKTTGPFHNMFMTFSTTPKIQLLTGSSLTDRYNQLCRADWTGSTNLEGMFDELLRVAMQHQVAAKDMPSMLLIMSDMEFNSCMRNPNLTALDMMKNQYQLAGYEMPKVVFWNLNARVGNTPAKVTDSNTALVSGFSPAIMTSILSAKEFTPRGVMFDKVMDDRYNLSTYL